MRRSNWPNLSKIALASNGNYLSPNLLRKNWPLLEELDLGYSEITQNEIELIVKRSNWPRLKHLNLSYNNISDEGINILSQGDWPLLEILNLGKTKITAVGIEAIVTRSKWPKLKYLNLSFNSRISDAGFETLSQGDWPLLEVLDLECLHFTKKTLLNVNLNHPNLKEIKFNEFGKDFAKNLLQRNWYQFEELDLSHSKITNNEIELIVNKCKWPQLKHINLSYNDGIGDEEIETLSQGDWPLLEILNLEKTKITAVGIETLIIQSKWLELKHLNISGNAEVGDKGLEVLSEGNWTLLETLNLSDTKITAVGIEAIVARSKWLELKCLNLSGNDEIEDSGLETLSRGNWPLLETLSLESTGETRNGVLHLLLRANWANLKEINLDKFSKDFGKGLLQKNWLQLEEISLIACGITQNEIELIVKRFNWPQLKLLDLSLNCGINDEGLEILSQGNWPLLETLEMRSTSITNKWLFNLFGKANWPNLREFYWDGSHYSQYLLPKDWPYLEKYDLSWNKFTEIELFVNKYKLPKLKHLNLSWNREITDEGVAILSRGNWPRLETLNLMYLKFAHKALLNFLLNANWPNFKEIIGLSGPAKNLAESFIKKDLSQVQRLELRNAKISLPEIGSILKRNKYKCFQLKYLDLSNNKIFGGGKVSALMMAECPLLEELHLENTRIGPREIKAIVNRAKWPLLKHFNVSNNELFDEGISVLSLAEWPLLENLNLSNTKLSMKGVDIIVYHFKWLQIKSLNISNHEISDEGLSVLALKEWTLLEDLSLRNAKITQQGIGILVSQVKLPNLKKLDISENSIFDEGLFTLLSGNWPLFQHLIYYETKVTCKGHITLLESFKWPNLSHLEHSLNESFYNFNEKLDEWSPPILLLAIAPMYYKTASSDMQRCLVSVLDMSWLNSQEIYLSIDYGDLKGKILMLPREKLDQLDTIHLSLEISPIQLILLPFNLKTLDLSGNSLADEAKLEILLLKNCPPIEFLLIDGQTNIGTKGIEVLVRQSNWSNLKKIHISHNPIGDVGLEMLTSAKWQLLETLIFMKTGITAKGIEALVHQSNWPNLKKLNISDNSIRDEGLEMLTSGKWQFIEELNLMKTGITAKGIEALVHQSNWPNLKKLNISYNSIKDEGIEILTSGKLQLLEDLFLMKTRITARGVEILARKSDWPRLKTLCIAEDKILDEGLEMLSHGKWPLLEKLYLVDLKITKEGMESLASTSYWSNLKIFDVSHNENISGALALVSEKWPLLESLRCCNTKMTLKDVETLINESAWPNLKEIYLEEEKRDYEIDVIQKLISEKWPQVNVRIKDYLSLVISELFGRDWIHFIEKMSKNSL